MFQICSAGSQQLLETRLNAPWSLDFGGDGDEAVGVLNEAPWPECAEWGGDGEEVRCRMIEEQWGLNHWEHRLIGLQKVARKLLDHSDDDRIESNSGANA